MGRRYRQYEVGKGVSLQQSDDRSDCSVRGRLTW